MITFETPTTVGASAPPIAVAVILGILSFLFILPIVPGIVTYLPELALWLPGPVFGW